MGVLDGWTKCPCCGNQLTHGDGFVECRACRFVHYAHSAVTASALPEEGGFYVWVRRALGPCWGFQEAWLSLVASVFDMAIYPALFVEYLNRLFPYFGIGHRGALVGLAIVTVCALLNIAGVRLSRKPPTTSTSCAGLRLTRCRGRPSSRSAA